MRSSTVQRLSLPIALCAVGFCASEVWNSKDSKEWTADDVNKILTESPWAKDTKIESGATGQQQQRRGMGRGGGMGGGGGGIGFPGSGGGMGRGGGGYPGGQYPNGGGQYPNGGGQYPNGGGQYPDSGGNYPNGGQGGGRVNLPATVLVRWQSAKVVQAALAKQDAPASGTAATAAPAPAEAAPAAAPVENRYVISVFGLQAPHRRNPDDDQDSTSISSRQGDAERTREQDHFREQLLDSAKLMLKRGAIIAVDVKFVEGVGSHEIQFFFPRSNDPISLDDKDVTFDVKIGRAKLEHKFHLKDMTVKGRLDL